MQHGKVLFVESLSYWTNVHTIGHVPICVSILNFRKFMKQIFSKYNVKEDWWWSREKNKQKIKEISKNLDEEKKIQAKKIKGERSW